MFKRLFYNYYLRDMSLASFKLPLGLLLLIFGTVFGIFHWGLSLRTGIATSPGSSSMAIYLAALACVLGISIGQVPLQDDGADVSSER
ncbi:hypothetical protein PSCICP_31820 [Pseudomonas cichorii]|uniref:Uncharacterized protein n=1 Tax=Pseudomonas cichorii TaxID=36746 RepID=A0ABQ1DQA0_PSECI|nr:hypothetical protein PSCICP_31820 [Pseudomonas cichorii]